MSDSPKYKLYLEDHGQDFLWLVVQGSKIVEAGPFQNSLWAGRKIAPPRKWRKGSRINFISGRLLSITGTLHYPVVRVEAL